MVFVWGQQILGQLLGALEVVHVDEGVGRQELFAVPPAGAKRHGHGPGWQGMLPQLLCDVVGVQVLQSQVTLVLGQALGRESCGSSL